MTSTKETLSQARQCHEDGRFHAAADLLLEAYRKSPADPAVARELGFLLHSVGDLAGAARFLHRAYQGDPTDSETVAEYVLVLHSQGRGEEASHLLVASLEQGLIPEELAKRLAAA